MRKIDLTAAVEAAAARLYADEHGRGATNVSAATLFAIVSDQMPPLARSYRDRARFQVEAAAPLIEQATRMADADGLHKHLVAHGQGKDGKCLCGSQGGYTTFAEHALETWLASHGIGGWMPRFYRPAGYGLHVLAESPVEVTNA